MLPIISSIGDQESIQKCIDELSEVGLRTLAFASKQLD